MSIYKDYCNKFEKIVKNYKHSVTLLSLSGLEVDKLLFADKVLDKIPNGKVVPSSENNSELTKSSTFCKSFLYILNTLKAKEKELLWNDFIENDKNWWSSKYSRSTYYRLKYKSLSDFFGVLGEEDYEQHSNEQRV